MNYDLIIITVTTITFLIICLLLPKLLFIIGTTYEFILFLFTSCFTVFRAFTNSISALFIISNFLGTTMKIRLWLVLCYPCHIALAFNCLWFKSLSVLAIIVNKFLSQNLIPFLTLVHSCTFLCFYWQK